MDRGLKTMGIPIEWLPKTKSCIEPDKEVVDFNKISKICQFRVDEIEYAYGYVVGIETHYPEIKFEKFCESIKKWYESTKPNAVYPIAEPFTANRCPKCNANLGGKKIDDCYYENPYYPECPNCHTKFEKFDWQE